MRARPMRIQGLPFLFALLSLLLLGLAQAAIAQDGSSVPGNGWAVELRLGAALESGDLGTTTGVGDGYFQFQRVEAAPQVGIGVSAPEFGPGIRPMVLVSYTLPADLRGSWTPCDPGLACPSILPPSVDGQASRFEAIAGLEFPILRELGPARPYASMGVGLRRYGFSYDEIGDAGSSFHLGEGSFSETDLMARFFVGSGFRFGAWEALIEGGTKLSTFGAGHVPVPSDVFAVEDLGMWAGPTLDLGRESYTDFAVSVGVRRYLD